MTEGATPDFVLRWTPSVAEQEVAVRAKQRASGVIWLYRIAGAVFLLAGAASLVSGDPSGIGLVAVGGLSVTDLIGRIYRWMFVYRRNPRAFLSTVEHVNEMGMTATTEYSTERHLWSRWTCLLALPDLLILMERPRATSRTWLLAKRGLTEPERWDALAQLARSHVPPHPHADRLGRA